MATRCEQCRNRIRGQVHRSVTGRRLCENCHTRLMGQTAGFMVGGGVPNAISTGGWFARAKRAMSGRRREG